MSKTRYAKFMMSLEKDCKEINNVSHLGAEFEEKNDLLKKYSLQSETDCDTDTFDTCNKNNKLKNKEEEEVDCQTNEYDEIKDNDKDESNQNNSSSKKFKNDILYDRLGSDDGVTLDELQNDLEWEQKSIRGNMTNMQKKRQFTLITINISSPDFNNGGFKKETYYFRKDAEFDIKNDFFKRLTNN